MPPRACDVAVVGGGPGGATVAMLLARAGADVVLLERERFPRFHVGESLLPANIALFERLGVHDTIGKAGFLVKYGASFYDQETDHEHTFYFTQDPSRPSYGYQVSRAEFDAILLDHARERGVTVLQPATASRLRVEPDGVRVEGSDERGAVELRARFLVDASGRDGFLATAVGRRDRVPNLGKVALFAHWDGARRASGIEEGNIRVLIFPDGWFWWIPLAGTRTSVGCVLHARTVRAHGGSIESLYRAMIERVPRVAAGLRDAVQVGALHRAANFAYVNRPMIGARFLSVGDALAFIDPIFSAGVYIAMQSAELAAPLILRALREERFDARDLRPYRRRVRRGIRPFFRFIHRYYEPAFVEVFLRPQPYLGMREAVTRVLAGQAFHGMSVRHRLSLGAFFAVARANTWVRCLQGRPVESRLEW